MEALVILITVFGVFLALVNIFVINDKDSVKLANWLEDHSYTQKIKEDWYSLDPTASSLVGNMLNNEFYKADRDSE